MRNIHGAYTVGDLQLSLLGKASFYIQHQVDRSYRRITKTLCRLNWIVIYLCIDMAVLGLFSLDLRIPQGTIISMVEKSIFLSVAR